MNVPETFLWSGVSSGVKKSGNPDLALFYSAYPATVAGVFTQNSFAAAPVIESRKRLDSHDTFRGLVVNSGVANAATGEAGIKNNRLMIQEAANRLGVNPSNILSASTGHIGEQLPVEQINSSLPDAVDNLEEDLDSFSRAILTTDTTTKVVTEQISGLDADLTGVAKGAGMINPGMATMLAFLFLDHPVESEFWQSTLSGAVDKTFNEITVDGETSTNDTILAFASNRSDREALRHSDELAPQLVAAVESVCDDLSRKIVEDGEGATCTVEINVNGAKSETVATDVAESVAGSNLFKTALYGDDPNWGRVYSALGSTGHDLNPDDIIIEFNGHTVYDPGNDIRNTPSELKTDMKERSNHQVVVSLREGNCSARRLTCDLTEEYIRINADYEP